MRAATALRSASGSTREARRCDRTAAIRLHRRNASAEGACAAPAARVGRRRRAWSRAADRRPAAKRNATAHRMRTPVADVGETCRSRRGTYGRRRTEATPQRRPLAACAGLAAGRGSASMTAAAVEFRGVSFSGPGAPPRVEDLDLSIQSGELLVLLGRSGSGKTTTLKLINRLLTPSRGVVLVDVKWTKERTGAAILCKVRYATTEAGIL